VSELVKSGWHMNQVSFNNLKQSLNFRCLSSAQAQPSHSPVPGLSYNLFLKKSSMLKPGVRGPSGSRTRVA